MNNNKKTVAVIFGGRSAEHDISIITAHTPIIESLLASGNFDVVPIYITKDGSWYSESAMNNIAYFRGEYAERLVTQKKVHLLFDNGLKLIWPGFRQKIVSIDVVFPAMHGTYGEDGSLMGLLRMANVPFVGCDIFASAVAMDKVLTKQVISAEGVPVVPYVWFTRSDWENEQTIWRDAISKLHWPLFVKPVHLGSSIGIAKVKNEKELEQAIEVAFHYDNKALVEESIENLIEVTLPIMGNDELRLAEIERPMNKSEFFDFNDKYISGNKKSGGVNNQYSEIPANINRDLVEKVKEFGKKTYRVLGCEGIARIDFLIDSQSKNVYVNEVNTLPGSLYHHNWRKAGVSGVELVTKLITLAFKRFERDQNTTYTFSSDILRKVGGPKKN
ncbi:MAG: D-alanine-D-alanine ligase [Parcubacteria group bacterium Gr01-1014_48]|nr:MAG: D-alanine-D-alanine ligase [Parcubacteria group bacterium Greene0416_14]TSC72077.1 MAG: D-alanine-D-alanine ligase [Parcubacteria group bacterium Gr01-1014_48]TSC99742.1 MAG: D-alanine-D-alanine ligase [Parcubacteria group bacterium Greene1014_15]TSD07042.1 MAG: D-alanine-D-alanine ligase [Parcubacteria group bacterium Greene0714_4]